jgi:tetratricopeptide (TPR) repeat protein
MTKSRILLIVFVTASTIALYLLPRYVVNNDSQDIRDETADNATMQTSEPDEHNHIFEIPDSLQQKFESLYVSYKNAENQEKRFIFADSLAKAYKTVGKLDSLAKYQEMRALRDPSLENLILAGDGYYEAFNFAVDQSKRTLLAQKAQDYFSRVLEEDPLLLDVKSKLAMTYVTGAEPMKGIMMLREVLTEDPDHELAIYNLGILAITSGQLDKAIERFEKLLDLNPENPEANFYMGYCLNELGREKESKPYFEKVLTLDISGDLAITSENYLKNINN